MQVVDAKFVSGTKVLLRYDIDVALENGKIVEDFKLKTGLETLRLCITNASKVIIIGHLGRPFKTAENEKKGNPSELSAKPIQEWFEKELGESVDFAKTLEKAKASESKVVNFSFIENPYIKYTTIKTTIITINSNKNFLFPALSLILIAESMIVE